MSTLLLHVGPHKTGSTAIQNQLADNAVPLQNAGWAFETLADFDQGVHGLADKMSMGRYEESQPLIAALAARQGAAENTIVSSENLSRLNGDQAKTLIQALPFDAIRVVYYLRNPLVRLQSAWRERVKHGYRHTLVEFIAGRLLAPFQDNEINDLVRLRPWVDAVGRENVDVHLYDDIPNAAAHFYTTYVDAAGEPNERPRRVNLSPSVERVEILRALAGYQVHLLRHRDFDGEIDQILARIADIQAARDNAYTKSISLSLDSAILRRIEVETARVYRGAGGDNSPLFTPRATELTYLAPEIWFENPELMAMVFDLRRQLSDQYGTPVFDQRLAKL